MVGQTQNGRSTSSARKRWEANQQNPSGTAAHAAAKVRMYWCNLILQAIMNRKPGQVGASMYSRSRTAIAGQSPSFVRPGQFGQVALECSGR